MAGIKEFETCGLGIGVICGRGAGCGGAERVVCSVDQLAIQVRDEAVVVFHLQGQCVPGRNAVEDKIKPGVHPDGTNRYQAVEQGLIVLSQLRFIRLLGYATVYR